MSSVARHLRVPHATRDGMTYTGSCLAAVREQVRAALLVLEFDSTTILVRPWTEASRNRCREIERAPNPEAAHDAPPYDDCQPVR